MRDLPFLYCYFSKELSFVGKSVGEHVLYTCFSRLLKSEEASRTQANHPLGGAPWSAGVGPSDLHQLLWG